MDKLPGAQPYIVALASRHHREDLSRDEIVGSAEKSTDDICTIKTQLGELGLHWSYGARRLVPRVWGTLSVGEADVSKIKPFLNRLSDVSGCTYGVCDLEKIRDESMSKEVDVYESDGVVSALQALYWYNYYAPEYRNQLPITDGVRMAAAELEESAGGGLVIITRHSPKDGVDTAKLSALAREWPVFRKYDSKARFRSPVRIDYSGVWSLPGAVSKAATVGSVIGEPDEFIASVSGHAELFFRWSSQKGLHPKSEEDFQRIFHEHEPVIRDELLVPAIAAYGELVRQKLGGRWEKARLFHRGEPIVVKPGRPWTARRVILEVLEGLEPKEE